MNDTQRDTVVLLHSSASSARQWMGLAEMLRDDFRVVAVEFHGHGVRPDWNGDRAMALADDAALAAPLLETEGAVHLVGHSYGAAVALKLACQFPKRVSSVVAYEPVLFRLLFADPRAQAEAQAVLIVVHSMRDALDHGRPDLAALRFIDFWSGEGTWRAMPEATRQAVASRMPSVVRHFDALFGEAISLERMAKLDMPLLFLSGTRTVPTARRIGQALRAALPLAGHDKLPGMGHMGPLTHPAVVNPRIRQFLHTHAVRGAAVTSC